MVAGGIQMVNHYKSWYIFAVTQILNKEFNKDIHTEPYYNAIGSDELNYICRIFTNRFCKNDADCVDCVFRGKRYLTTYSCPLWIVLQKIRGAYE